MPDAGTATSSLAPNPQRNKMGPGQVRLNMCADLLLKTPAHIGEGWELHHSLPQMNCSLIASEYWNPVRF